MIKLDVHSYNGSSLPQSLGASLDELGGTIGRADNNQLVLPDPERTVSRVHAQVVFRNGGYTVVDRGSNAISVNGHPLGNGQEAALHSGDELEIGGYAIRVTVGAAAASEPAPTSNDPFADFGFAAPPSAGVSRAPRVAGVAEPAAGSSLDPLAAFGAAPSPGGAPRAPAPAGGIPDDWNPFAPDPAAAPVAPRPPLSGRGSGHDFGLETGAAAPAPLVTGLPIGGNPAENSLDALFGLGAPGGGDPFANSKLDAPIAQPNMAAHGDPMRSLNSATRGTAAAAADQLSDLNRPFVAHSTPVTQPRMRAPAPPRSGPVPSAPISPPKAAASAVLSWGDDSGQNRTVIRPKPAPPAGASSVAAAPALHVPSAAAPAPSTANLHAASASAASADLDALTRALCEGLGLPALPGGPLTPTRMRLIGVLLHEATRGTVELLIARAALKREVRAELTKIVARENNPLKFSPNVEVALSHLLGPTARGFIAPGAAMRDAYDDLRAHQFGFLAGMRAALEGVLKRFDPGVLESKLTQKSLLATLLPSTRKAQMWEVFQQLYSQISAEAADDFHELFGKEFLRAYEAHIDELQKDGT